VRRRGNAADAAHCARARGRRRARGRWGTHVVTLPLHFHETVAIAGLDKPTAVQFASDGRVFVAEKSGSIFVFSGLSDGTPTEFAVPGSRAEARRVDQ
jgi:hypothetical protein